MMRRKFFISLIAMGAASLAFMTGCSVLVVAMLETCGDAEIGRHLSSDGRWAAVVSRADCGATTPFSTHVTLERNGGVSWLSTPKSILGLRNLHNLKLRWLENKTLRITLPPNTEVFYRKEKIGGVVIDYVDPVSSAIAIPGELPRWCGSRLTTNFFKGAGEDIIVRLSGHLKRRIIRSEIWNTANEQPRSASVPVWVLELDFETPVLVEPVGGGSPKRWITVREIGLVGDGYTLPVADKYLNLSGRHVLVTGALRTANWTWEPSPVSIDEKKVELVGPMTCDGTPIATN